MTDPHPTPFGPPRPNRDLIRRLILAALGAGLGLTGIAAPPDFARDVEPILVKRCSECHGPDAQKAGLRLDSREAALKPSKSGQPAIVPSRPAESGLVKRITSADPDEVMPPKGARLTATEVEVLQRWIESDALWPVADPREHWAFRTPTAAEPPAVTNVAWPRHELDRFVLHRLEREGLEPEPETDRPTLLRRVSFDLTGLPPTPAEVRAFESDTSPEAYARVVERLLASPHYGEHLARGWLDLARYADSNGYQVDLARSIWPYRDWVIEAFNRNQPFDQFTIDQLAGDLLPQPTLAQRVATGFNRNTKINDEGGGDAEEYRVKAVKDRLATLGTAWLGLTLNCAECHSHKYDPISHEEYYRLYAFFNNTTDGGNYSTAPTVEVPKPDLSAAENHLRARLVETQRQLATVEASLAAERPAWEQDLARKGDVWHALSDLRTVSTGGSSYTNLADGSVLATGVNPIYDTIQVEAETDLTGITAVRLEVLPDPSLPKQGPGRWGQTGNFILDELSLSAVPREGPAPASTNVALARATADWEQHYYRAEHAIDRNPKTGWAIGPRFGQPHFLIAELAEPIGFTRGTRLGFRFEHYHGSSHTIGRFRLSVTRERNPLACWPIPPEIRPILTLPTGERTPEQQTLLARFQRAASPEVRALERERLRIEERLGELSSRKFSTLVVQERSEPEPRPTHVQNRGNFLDPGTAVTAGVPAVFPGLPAGQPANRLTLARWLVDPAHPLTARVAVNRLWEHCFGTGLVKTSEDFGRQGEAPSHPELLDFLARRFVNSGWDTKALLRDLVLSATYRQSAAADFTRLERDPYNRLLSRGPRFRLDAETIRDQALAVSGLLNPQVGGPSVHPVQLPNLWKEIGFLRPEIGMDEWPLSEGPDLYRRGVYTFWRRVCTYPSFATFDAPSREVCVARRPRTNTPLQALAALNDPTLLEAARVFAQRILTEGGPSAEAQLTFAFTTCLGRQPTTAERDRLLAFHTQQLEGFRRDPGDAETLLQTGSAPRPPNLDPQRIAAWMMVANALLNLDETLTKG